MVNETLLRKWFIEYLSASELQDLCFDLRIDYESLPGQSKPDKARELIIYVRQRGQVARLLAACQDLRPDVTWSAVLPPAPAADPPPPPALSARASAAEAPPLRLTLLPGAQHWSLLVENIGGQELTAIRIALELPESFDLRPSRLPAIPRLAAGAADSSLLLSPTPPQAPCEEEVLFAVSLKEGGRPAMFEVTATVHFFWA